MRGRGGGGGGKGVGGREQGGGRDTLRHHQDPSC
jgi:hypothetical protein